MSPDRVSSTAAEADRVSEDGQIRATTFRPYEVHVERRLIPHLGRVRLGALTGRHITDMITAIGVTTNRYGRTPTPSTLHRIRATLRSALNAAIREGLLRENPARHVEVPSPRRPHALVWTPQRVEVWQKSGERPSVAVWTTEQTATFLSIAPAEIATPVRPASRPSGRAKGGKQGRPRTAHRRPTKIKSV